MTQHQTFKLSRLDEEIAGLEKKLKVKHEQRRELVNRMGLNKGGALKSDRFYVVGESGTDTLTPNKCKRLSDHSFEVSSPNCVHCGMNHRTALDLFEKGLPQIVDNKDKNKCDHKRKTCVDVTAMSDEKTKIDCLCDDCGCQLPWQHTELKP